MKIFGDYLRRHLGGIGILLACCGIFVLVFSLYDLPAEAVLYGGVLSAVLYQAVTMLEKRCVRHH